MDFRIQRDNILVYICTIIIFLNTNYIVQLFNFKSMSRNFATHRTLQAQCNNNTIVRIEIDICFVINILSTSEYHFTYNNLSQQQFFPYILGKKDVFGTINMIEEIKYVASDCNSFYFLPALHFVLQLIVFHHRSQHHQHPLRPNHVVVFLQSPKIFHLHCWHSR